MRVFDRNRQAPRLNMDRFILLLVVAGTLLLALLNFFWYWISPLSSGYPAGRFLLILYLLATFVWVLLRAKLPFLVSIVAILFGINILYYVNFASSIVDETKHDGVWYYITYSLEPFDGWQDYDLTARSGLFRYVFHGLVPATQRSNLKLKYDATIGRMTVIESDKLYDRKTIISIEGDEPLFYEAFAELSSYGYYLFSRCKQLGINCQDRIYFLYRCKLDNTYCERLPFMYDGEYGGYSSNLLINEATSEIEIYFEPYVDQEQKEVLIYSYGREPRCYVEGCHIPETP
jgi:hypothetical protein